EVVGRSLHLVDVVFDVEERLPARAAVSRAEHTADVDVDVHGAVTCGADRPDIGGGAPRRVAGAPALRTLAGRERGRPAAPSRRGRWAGGAPTSGPAGVAARHVAFRRPLDATEAHPSLARRQSSLPSTRAHGPSPLDSSAMTSRPARSSIRRASPAPAPWPI